MPGYPASSSGLTLGPASSEAKSRGEAPAVAVPKAPSSISTKSTIAPSHSSSVSSSSSVGSFSEDRRRIKAINWEELRLGYRIQPVYRHASSTDDIYLLSAFLDLAKVPDVDGASAKLLLRMLRLLHRCSYSAVDICSILAHASSYFIDVFQMCGNYMDAAEVGNVLVTVVFLAHSYIQDETCPLKVWHEYLFRGYCPLKKLSEAIIRVMAIRKYILRVDDAELTERYDTLCVVMKVTPVELVC